MPFARRNIFMLSLPVTPLPLLLNNNDDDDDDDDDDDNNNNNSNSLHQV
jgi:hypothetical protein